MKTKSIIIAASLAALVILSAGCKKQSVTFRGRTGDEIRFAIRSGAPATKTVYNDNNGQYFSIETTDGESTIVTKYEGIDWVEGDKMTVAYIYADPALGVDLGDYRIAEGSVSPSSISGGRVFSQGKLNSVEPNGLQWHDGDVHQFYASYPALDENYPQKDKFVFEVAEGRIHAEVPYYYPMTLSSSDSDDMTKNGRVWVENMKYAYMNTMNGNPSNVEKGGTITMNVAPHFTAFEIEVAAAGTDVIPLKSFTLSSGADLIGGTFFLNSNYDEKGDLYWPNVPLDGEGNTSNTITVDFSGESEYENGGILLTNENPIKFTVFVRGGWWLNQMTVGFNIIKDGARVNRSLKLAYVPVEGDTTPRWISFSSNCKHRISGLQIPLELPPVSLWFEGTNAGSYGQGTL